MHEWGLHIEKIVNIFNIELSRVVVLYTQSKFFYLHEGGNESGENRSAQKKLLDFSKESDKVSPIKICLSAV